MNDRRFSEEEVAGMMKDAANGSDADHALENDSRQISLAGYSLELTGAAQAR